MRVDFVGALFAASVVLSSVPLSQSKCLCIQVHVVMVSAPQHLLLVQLDWLSHTQFLSLACCSTV